MSSPNWIQERTADAERVWTARAVDAMAMRQRGAELASVVRAGDVLVVDGPLGAGKTTFVQGLAAALGVRGAVTSPTFVISRVHRGPRVDLVHVDAYRLTGAVELDDLDLDAEVAESVTVIEWGTGKAEELAADRLHVVITSEADDAPSGAGTTTGHNLTERWQSEHSAADAGQVRLATGQPQANQNRAGQNQAGQNQAGQNQAGQNQAGQNQAGQNQAGQNQAGQNLAGQTPADQNSADQNSADQNSADHNPADFGLFDASAGIRVIQVHGVGPRWAQLRL